MQKILTNPLNALLCLVGVFYFATCPTTVMPLDSAEMTYKSVVLRVMHPPGYPLLSAYNAFFIELLGFLRPLIAVTVGNIFLGLLTLAVAGKLALRIVGPRSLFLIASLAVSPVFWMYATSPEVFIGLQLFAVAFCWLLFFPNKYREPWFITFLALSVLHHQTIVFLAPWVLRAAWLNRSHIQSHIIAVMAGAFSLAGYGLLMLYNPTELFSWGNVTDWSAVLAHFLRLEYGTFALSISKNSPALFERIAFGVTTVVQNAFLPLVVIMISLTQQTIKWTTAQKILAGTAIIYVLVFTLLGVVQLNVPGMEVYRRFFILPIVLLYVLSATLVASVDSRSWNSILILTFCSICLGSYHGIREATSGMREISEQYHRDLLTTFPPDSVVHLNGDTLLFTSTYLQVVEGVRRDVALVPPSLLNWEGRKLLQAFPERFSDDYRAQTLMERLRAGLGYNVVGLSVSFNSDQEVERQEMSYRIGKGKASLRFSCDPNGPVYRGPPFPFSEYTIYAGQVLGYGLCDFTKALYLLRIKKTAAAEASLRTATRKSPYNPFFQERLCSVLQGQEKEFSDCNRRLDILLEETDSNFLKVFRPSLVPAQVEVIWKDGDYD